LGCSASKDPQRELLHAVPFKGIVVLFCVVLELVTLKGKKKIQATPTKQDLATSKGVLFKISNEHAHPFETGALLGILSRPDDNSRHH